MFIKKAFLLLLNTIINKQFPFYFMLIFYILNFKLIFFSFIFQYINNLFQFTFNI